MGITLPNMARLVTALFLATITVAHAGLFSSNKEEAHAFLRSKQYLEVSELATHEKWEELKDKLEDMSHIPEEQVDALESCLSNCWWSDKASGMGKLFNAKEMAAETMLLSGKGEKSAVACAGCIEKIPEASNIDKGHIYEAIQAHNNEK